MLLYNNWTIKIHFLLAEYSEMFNNVSDNVFYFMLRWKEY